MNNKYITQNDVIKTIQEAVCVSPLHCHAAVVFSCTGNIKHFAAVFIDYIIEVRFQIGFGEPVQTGCSPHSSPINAFII